MNQNGVTVYMQTTPAGLASRLVNAKRQRPLLEGKSPEELILYVTEKLKEREKWYTQAHFKIDAINPDLPKLIGEIYSLISEK
jgi:shikimate kinase